MEGLGPLDIRVLLVDDDPAILQTMGAILRLHGLSVTASSCAADAIERLAQHVFDLAITDMRMEKPNSGYEVVCAAAALSVQPRIVVMTAFPILGCDLQVLRPVTVLQKGTSPELLMERLREVIDVIATRRRPAAPDNRSDPVSRSA
jgi:CheY-like chemotaxis protein